MLFKYQPSLSTKRVAHLTLQNDAERALTDSELLRLVDNRDGIVFRHDTASYELTGNGFGPQRHFGGSVDRDGDSVVVTVRID